MRSFAVKVNRKALAQRFAVRSPTTQTMGRSASSTVPRWDDPSTKNAAGCSSRGARSAPSSWSSPDDEDNLAKSFRNLDRVVVVTPGELEVAAVVWARSLLVSQAAIEGVEARAGNGPIKRRAKKEDAE